MRSHLLSALADRLEEVPDFAEEFRSNVASTAFLDAILTLLHGALFQLFKEKAIYSKVATLESVPWCDQFHDIDHELRAVTSPNLVTFAACIVQSAIIGEARGEVTMITRYTRGDSHF